MSWLDEDLEKLSNFYLLKNSSVLFHGINEEEYLFAKPTLCEKIEKWIFAKDLEADNYDLTNDDHNYAKQKDELIDDEDNGDEKQSSEFDILKASKQNVFLARTFDPSKLKEQLALHNQNEYKLLSRKQRLRVKKERTKMLMTKTRRDSYWNSESTRLLDYSHKNSMSTYSWTGDIKNDCRSKRRKYTIDEFVKNKKIRKQSNREAAQKYRMSKNAELKILKEKEDNLENENKKLKLELNLTKLMLAKVSTLYENNLKNKNNKKEEQSNVENTRDVNGNFKAMTNESDERKKQTKKTRKVSVQSHGINQNAQNNQIRITQNNMNTPPSANLSSCLSKATIFTGLLFINCVLGNFLSKEKIKKFDARILIDSISSDYNNTVDDENLEEEFNENLAFQLENDNNANFLNEETPEQ